MTGLLSLFGLFPTSNVQRIVVKTGQTGGECWPGRGGRKEEVGWKKRT